MQFLEVYYLSSLPEFPGQEGIVDDIRRQNNNDGKHGPKFEDNPTRICCTKHDEMYFKNYKKKKDLEEAYIYCK